MKSTNTFKIPLLFCLSLMGFLVLGYGQHEAYFIGDGISKLEKLEEAGQEAYEKNDYYTAYGYYKEALKIDSLKLENRYKMAEAARGYGAYCVASDIYGQVVALDSFYVLPEAKIKFGEMELLKGDYTEADTRLAEAEDSDLTQKIKRNIDFEATAPAPNDRVNVFLLDSTINTIHTELNPVWRNGELYYSSMAYKKSKDAVRPRRLYAKTLRSNLQNPGTEWKDFNVKDKSTTHISFTPEGDRMYFTICDYGKKDRENDVICQIYYKDKIGQGNDNWGAAQKLPEWINNEVASSTHPSVGKDEKGKDVLYFVSNKASPDGEGGNDIWYSHIINKDSFSAPINLAWANTDGNEITPFYHFPSETLYFSSDNHPGYGGYDIYYSAIENNDWQALENAHRPINSSSNDFNYFLKDTEDGAFLISNRDDCAEAIELDGACHDIYLLEIEPCTTDVLVALFEEDGSPLYGGMVQIQEEDIVFAPDEISTTNEFRFSNFKLFGNKSLQASKEGFYPKTEIVEIVECTPNTFDIYLSCKASMTLGVFERRVDTENTAAAPLELPVSNCTVNLVRTQEASEGDTRTQNNHLFEFDINKNTSYSLSIINSDYKAYSQTFSSGICDTLLKIYLEPINEFDTIACYFDHDFPKRIRLPGIPDENTNDIYDDLHRDYLTVLEGVNNQRTDDFFINEVIPSFELLERFKDDLLIRLEAGKSYTVFLKGYASADGTFEYNKKLAQRRITSVRNYFLERHKEAFNKYIYETKTLAFDNLPVGEYGAGERVGKYNPKRAVKRRVDIIRIPDLNPNAIGGRE